LEADIEPYMPWLKYTQLLDRGGLKYPSIILSEIAFLFYTITHKLMSSEYEAKFLACNNHKKILINIVTCTLQKHNTFVSSSTCVCGANVQSLLLHTLPVFANIFLNNYIKIKNDKVSLCSQRKISKFSWI
jgi:hypothetical protein